MWGMAHEQQLKAMMYACNGNNWDSWENLLDQCELEPALVDARYFLTLIKVLITVLNTVHTIKQH